VVESDETQRWKIKSEWWFQGGNWRWYRFRIITHWIIKLSIGSSIFFERFYSVTVNSKSINKFVYFVCRCTSLASSLRQRHEGALRNNPYIISTAFADIPLKRSVSSPFVNNSVKDFLHKEQRKRSKWGLTWRLISMRKTRYINKGKPLSPQRMHSNTCNTFQKAN